MESKNPAAPDSVRLALCGAPPALTIIYTPQKSQSLILKKRLKSDKDPTESNVIYPLLYIIRSSG